jgi:predicted nucleotidyltransferase
MNLHIRDIMHIIEPFAGLDETTAISVGGSFAAGTADHDSDVDIYIYNGSGIPVDFRREVASELGEQQEINNRFWEHSDTWKDKTTGKMIDITFRSPSWMVNEIRRLLVDYQPRLGYTTCTWDNLLRAVAVYDPSGWYEDLKQTSLVPYPPELRDAIIRHNHNAIRGIHSSYFNQLQLAVHRADILSVNHRINAILESYFDIIFAVNRVTHPGEKRILDNVKRLCNRTPKEWDADVKNLVCSVPWMSSTIIEAARILVDRLDEFLEKENPVREN